tara:strand:+ start:146 stop:847 length:702 start_codon:yes stop_codon:yes gene_type:complete
MASQTEIARSVVEKIDGFSFERFHEDDEEAVLNMIAEGFSSREPLTTNMSVPFEAFRDSFVKEVVKKALSDNLSLVIRDSATNMVMGALLNEDFHDTISQESEDGTVSHPVTPILELLGALDEIIVKDCFPNLKERQVFHAFMGTTQKGYEGRGLAKKLRAVTAKFAKTQGFDYLVVEPTNPITLIIWKKLGAEVVATIHAPDFKCADGSAPFAGTQIKDVHAVRLDLNAVEL